jgi:hypothetical protein
MTEAVVNPEPVAVIIVAGAPAFSAAGVSEVRVTGAGAGVEVELFPPLPPQAAARPVNTIAIERTKARVSAPLLIFSQAPYYDPAGYCYM